MKVTPQDRARLEVEAQRLVEQREGKVLYGHTA
jgi:hypothetical protein